LGIHSSIDVDVKEGLPSSSFNANTMLLGEAFQEPVSPTLGKAGRTRPFKRNISSSRDPMSGVGTLDLPMTEAQDVANRSVSSTGSPRVRRDAQRRRLVGTSPKKLSRAAETGRFDKEDAEDDDDDLGPAWEQRVSKPTQTNSSFDWHAEIRRFYDRVDSTLVLDGRGLTSIDPAVADLAKYVMLNKLSMLQKNDDATSTPPSSGSTPFSRTNSLANANDALSTGSPSSQRTRSNNGALTQQMNSGPQLNFANNDIHQLPSALFAVTNMTMLSIRGNKIGRLPAAIGQLVNLKELNVSRCGLSYLPAEIQKLRLVRFTSFPNPFLCPSKDARLTVRRCYGKWTGGAHDQVSVHDEPEPVLGSMGPPAVPSRARSSGTAARFASRSSFAAAGQRSGGDDEQIDTSSSQETTSLPVIARFLSTELYAEVAFPNLKEVCLRRLLQPVRDGDKKALGTLLEHYEAGSLSRLDRGINVETVRALEAARRSSAGTWDQYRPDSTRAETWCSGALADSHWSDDDMLDGRYDNSDDGHASAEWSSGDGHEAYRYQSNPRTGRDLEADLDQGDDAVGNPWFNRCPNPLHGHTENSIAVPSEVLSDWPSADATKVFAKPCVQRIEWVSHIGGYKVANTAVSSERLGIRDEKTKPLAENSGCIPILWRGCGVRCLDFLEAI
jgi:Leucine-rich repeat (LRR) protein